MGFAIFKKSTTIIPKELGIMPTTVVTAICVGSGGGGGSGGNATYLNGGSGGASGCGGISTKLSVSGYFTGAGGGGGGYGAGGGGGAGAYNTSSGSKGLASGGGSGGAAGDVKIVSFVFDDVQLSVAITVGQRVPHDTSGESSSVGKYITALGGTAGNAGESVPSSYGSGTPAPKGGASVGNSGAGQSGTTYNYGGPGGAGGGGEGGYQIGIFKNGGKGGDAGQNNATLCGGASGDYNGGGHEYMPGQYGGGRGGHVSDLSDGEDGYAYLGDAGSGLVMLFW